MSSSGLHTFNLSWDIIVEGRKLFSKPAIVVHIPVREFKVKRQEIAVSSERNEIDS